MIIILRRHPERSPTPVIRFVWINSRILEQLHGNGRTVLLAGNQQWGEAEISGGIHVDPRDLEEPPEGLLLIALAGVVEGGSSLVELGVDLHPRHVEDELEDLQVPRITGAREGRGVVSLVHLELVLRAEELANHVNVAVSAGDGERGEVDRADVDPSGGEGEEDVEDLQVAVLTGHKEGGFPLAIAEIGHEIWLLGDPLHHLGVASGAGEVEDGAVIGLLHEVDEMGLILDDLLHHRQVAFRGRVQEAALVDLGHLKVLIRE